MIVGIQGNQGNGKTATLAYLAFLYFSKGFKIHANFWLEIPDLEPHYVTCMNDIDKIYQGYAFFDEFWTWADSRVSGYSDLNAAITKILMNARKRGYSIFYESKRVHFTDRRIRELTDYILEPHLYYNNNGSLEIIMQDMLNPVHLEDYLEDLWVIVDKYRVHGQKMIKIIDEDEIIFKLQDVTTWYDTREEIKALDSGEQSAGIEKGIRKENQLTKFIRAISPSEEILHNHNSLGWDVRTKKQAFDCVSITSSKTTQRPYIDVRNKKIKELLQDARKEKRTPYWAYHFKDQWFCIPMIEAHAKRSILNTREAKPLIECLRDIETCTDTKKPLKN
jgi:hypothetical protein